jgi:membrane fusion protein (multidrug efflux system)
MGTGVVVDAGLKEGEIVVVSGIQKIKPGMVVTPTRAAATEETQSPETDRTSDAASEKTPPTPARETGGTEPETAEPPKTEPAKTEPAKTEKDSADETTPQPAPKTES